MITYLTGFAVLLIIGTKWVEDEGGPPSVVILFAIVWPLILVLVIIEMMRRSMR